MRFDDGNVSSLTPGRAITDSAYLLWYELKVEKDATLPFDHRTIHIAKHHKFPDYEELTPDEILLLHKEPPPSASVLSPCPASQPPPPSALPEKKLSMPQQNVKVTLPPKRIKETPVLPPAKIIKLAPDSDVCPSDDAKQITSPALNARSLAHLVTPSAQNLKVNILALFAVPVLLILHDQIPCNRYQHFLIFFSKFEVFYQSL